MYEMTKAQKDYINSVILPTLIDLAINDPKELDDLNCLHYHHFEKATQEYNASPEQQKARKVKALSEYLCEDEFTIEEQYETLLAFDGAKDTQLCSIEGIEPAEGYEFWCINFLWDRLPA